MTALEKVQTLDDYLEYQDGISDCRLGVCRDGMSDHYYAGYMSEYASEEAKTAIALGEVRDH